MQGAAFILLLASQDGGGAPSPPDWRVLPIVVGVLLALWIVVWVSEWYDARR